MLSHSKTDYTHSKTDDFYYTRKQRKSNNTGLKEGY